MFMVDRTVDLFIGFNRPDGQPETQIINIINPASKDSLQPS